MTPDEAHQFTIRYKNIWRGGPGNAELDREFAEMDYQPAAEAMQRLARNTEHPPSLSTIWSEYRIRTAAPPQHLTVDACDTCGKAIDDPRRWRHETCQPDPNIIEAMRAARAQINRRSNTP